MDIVERLRVIGNPVSLSAADEIERLRADVAAERELADRLAHFVPHSDLATPCKPPIGVPMSEWCSACDALAAWRERRATAAVRKVAEQ